MHLPSLPDACPAMGAHSGGHGCSAAVEGLHDGKVLLYTRPGLARLLMGTGLPPRMYVSTKKSAQHLWLHCAQREGERRKRRLCEPGPCQSGSLPRQLPANLAQGTVSQQPPFHCALDGLMDRFLLQGLGAEASLLRTRRGPFCRQYSTSWHAPGRCISSQCIAAHRQP